MIRYISTRGGGQPQNFTDVLMQGMAPDGGLFIPDSWPEFDHNIMAALSGLSYTNTAVRVMQPFIGRALKSEKLFALLGQAYRPGVFDHTAIAPLTQIGPNAWLLELFHGPTFSFKDYALQFMGRLFDHLLSESGQKITIVGATSGDTGSAAIEAFRHCKNADIFILHPQGRTSEIQRRQMTTVQADNVFNVAIEGTFDDCQALVKALFADEKLRRDLSLSAVNSINFARIMAQVAYYAAAASALGAPHRPVSFAVPTGNFGNVYAAWVARRMGFPIGQLVIGTNRNDILTRFFETGSMTVESVVPSLSPSMDIQVSSNFERYLCEALDRDHLAVVRLMDDLKNKKSFTVPPAVLERAQADFCAYRCADLNTIEMVRECHASTGLTIDPHTAVALSAAVQAMNRDPATPMVILGCAHPAKFPDAVKQATGKEPPLPESLAKIMKRPEMFTPLAADLEKLKTFIRQNARPG